MTTNTVSVNPQVVDTLGVIQNNVLSGSVTKQSGAGKAYQSVSQSSALAVQDATDSLRNVSTMATTAMGVAMAQMLATGEVEPYSGIIAQANLMVTNSTTNFGTIGKSASELLGEFPTGD